MVDVKSQVWCDSIDLSPNLGYLLSELMAFWPSLGLT